MAYRSFAYRSYRSHGMFYMGPGFSFNPHVTKFASAKKE